MPKFVVADKDRPYGSLCGEGFTKTHPSDKDFLTLMPALRREFVELPSVAAELIYAYLPVSPALPRRCNLALYNYIERTLGVCKSYCMGFAQQALCPGFLTWWFCGEYDLVPAAITEEAMALDAMQKELERIYEPAQENAPTEDRLRPIISTLDQGLLEAWVRTIRGTEIILAQEQSVLESTAGDPAALGSVFKTITSLKSDWEPVFGTYKKLAAAVKQNRAIPQRERGRRFEVDVAAFLSWLDAVKAQRGTNGFDPGDSSTWNDEAWDAISLEFATHLREKRTARDEKRHQKG